MDSEPSARSVKLANIRTIGDKQYAEGWDRVFGDKKSKQITYKTMPYKSRAQAAYFHTHAKQLAKQGVNVSEWDKASKGKNLPARVKPKGKKK